MQYRDILGFSKKQPKKKVVKEEPKPTVTELLKEEFGDMQHLKENPIHIKQQLNEKKELNTNYIKKMGQMTDRNNHTEARYYLAHMMRNDKLSLFSFSII